MSRVLPILFNTEMVQAILDGRKTATRRIIHRGKSSPKYHGRDKFHKVVDHLNNDYKNWYAEFYNNDDVFEDSGGEKQIDGIYFKLPYKLGDILYVRETWYKDENCILYKANRPKTIGYRDMNGRNRDIIWRPSIHMPKEAARIWLKVTDVRVERLRDMKSEDAVREGVKESFPPLALDEFRDIWNSTIKKSELSLYGWAANPWVFVYEFERCEKPK